MQPEKKPLEAYHATDDRINPERGRPSTPQKNQTQPSASPISDQASDLNLFQRIKRYLLDLQKTDEKENKDENFPQIEDEELAKRRMVIRGVFVLGIVVFLGYFGLITWDESKVQKELDLMHITQSSSKEASTQQQEEKEGEENNQHLQEEGFGTTNHLSSTTEAKQEENLNQQKKTSTQEDTPSQNTENLSSEFGSKNQPAAPSSSSQSTAQQANQQRSYSSSPAPPEPEVFIENSSVKESNESTNVSKNTTSTSSSTSGVQSKEALQKAGTYSQTSTYPTVPVDDSDELSIYQTPQPPASIKQGGVLAALSASSSQQNKSGISVAPSSTTTSSSTIASTSSATKSYSENPTSASKSSSTSEKTEDQATISDNFGTTEVTVKEQQLKGSSKNLYAGSGQTKKRTLNAAQSTSAARRKDQPALTISGPKEEKSEFKTVKESQTMIQIFYHKLLRFAGVLLLMGFVLAGIAFMVGDKMLALWILVGTLIVFGSPLLLGFMAGRL